MHVYLHEFKRYWFLIPDWWILICFVCFVFKARFLLVHKHKHKHKHISKQVEVDKFVLLVLVLMSSFD